ncbi:hypothetical protein TNCT_108691 [Trichonephila clavata]|uniref:Uncharacterized protein n=1 Tax=Trichonephila clavata TaxID=2740835 RepID=A0A8X6H126_TRICU|nr:hypothetical protein TNCT_108691 [Trichonephila clavata]
MKGQINGLDFTVKMSRIRADVQVKGKKITENSITSALSEIQEEDICVDMMSLLRGIVGINGFQSDGMKSSWANVIFPHVQNQIQSDLENHELQWIYVK